MSNSILNISVDGFLEHYNKSGKPDSVLVKELKESARDSFKKLGFPSIKNEEWKYTNVSEISKQQFLTHPSASGLSLDEIKSFLPIDSHLIILVFENGIFNKQLSKTDLLPKGIIAGNIADYQDHPAVTTHLGKIAQHVNEGFVALNTAMFQQGVFIYAEKSVSCEYPIHILFINDARIASTICHQRNLIVASKGSSLKVSESYFSIKAIHPSFCNPVTEIFIDDNASVEYCKTESENAIDFHIDYTSAVLQRDAKLDIHTITTGGKMVRNNLRIELQKQNASAHLNGLYITDGDTHVDNHSVVDHASRECYSNELYKGVLGGKSTGVFNGKIFVRKDAQKTNAYQSNKNILLTDDASMNAKPQLEIYADDVKCSHGATTGQLNEEALFYLRSRGIGVDAAQALLTIAFAEDVLDRIKMESVKERLKEQIQTKLKNGNA